MSRRAVTGTDDPGAFQAIRKEVVAPFRHLLLLAAAVAAESQGTVATKEASQQRREQESKGHEGRQSGKTATAKHEGKEAGTATAAARRPLQAVTNAVPPPPPTQKGKPSASGGQNKAKLLALVSAVYEASYLSGCLAFPWDLALPELNALKEAAIAHRRASQQRQEEQCSSATAVERPSLK